VCNIHSSNCLLLQTSIPLVDLSQDEAAAAQQVYAACTGSGFFYAANHGISPELLSEVFRQMRAAFAMPEEAKMAMLADENNRGCKLRGCSVVKCVRKVQLLTPAVLQVILHANGSSRHS
jgi:isopenicillin N synthase-like dioxygenase